MSLPDSQEINFSTTAIRRIFVFHDPRNWALDIQISTDIILSNGVIGAPYTYRQEPREQEEPLSEKTEPVKIVFCNPDLQWRNEFARARLGQGAFKTAFQAVFKVSTVMNPYYALLSGIERHLIYLP